MKAVKINFKDALLKGTLVIFLGNMLGNVTNYLFQFFMSRNLSVTDFGAMNSLLSLLVIVSVPSVTILLVSTKFISRFKAFSEPEKVKLYQLKIMKKITGWGLPVLGGLMLLSPLVADFLHIQSLQPVILLFIILFFSFLLPANLGILQGLQKFFSLGAAWAVIGIAKLGIGILLITAGLRLNGAMAAILLSFVAGLALTFYLLRDLYSVDRSSNDLGIGHRGLLASSLPVVFCSLGITALTNLDLVLVKHFFSGQQAGIYASVAVLGRTIFYFPGAITLAMFPIVSESHALNKNSFHLLFKALALTVALSGGGLLVFLLFPDLMLSLLFGQTYAGGASFLRLFSLAMFFMALIQIVSSFLLAIEKYFFITVLLIGCALEALLICLFHQDLNTILLILGGVTFGTCAWLLGQAAVCFLRDSSEKAAGAESLADVQSPVL